MPQFSPDAVLLYYVFNDQAPAPIGLRMRRFSGIQRELAGRSIDFALIIAPELFGYRELKDYPYVAVHERLAGLSKEGIQVLDPLPALRERWNRVSDLKLGPDDYHKNARANGTISDFLAESLVASPAFREALRRAKR